MAEQLPQTLLGFKCVWEHWERCCMSMKALLSRDGFSAHLCAQCFFFWLVLGPCVRQDQQSKALPCPEHKAV